MFETWTLTLREERKLRVFVNMDEVRRDWRRLHNEELYDFYSSPNFVRVIKLKNGIGWACGAYG